jgi:hypothetical protein
MLSAMLCLARWILMGMEFNLSLCLRLSRLYLTIVLVEVAVRACPLLIRPLRATLRSLRAMLRFLRATLQWSRAMLRRTRAFLRRLPLYPARASACQPIQAHSHLPPAQPLRPRLLLINVNRPSRTPGPSTAVAMVLPTSLNAARITTVVISPPSDPTPSWVASTSVTSTLNALATLTWVESATSRNI